MGRDQRSAENLTGGKKRKQKAWATKNGKGEMDEGEKKKTKVCAIERREIVDERRGRRVTVICQVTENR